MLQSRLREGKLNFIITCFGKLDLPPLIPEAQLTTPRRKFSNKKHKTWDGDGILAVSSGYARLQDDSGKEMGRSTCNKAIELGTVLSIGGKEVEIESQMTRKDYYAGRPFLGHQGLTVRDLDEKLRTNVNFTKKPPDINGKEVGKPLPIMPATSAATKSSYKNPLLNREKVPVVDRTQPKPRHNPNAPGALVMKRPTSVPKGKQVVDVVVDPVLSQKLRDHQREGVKFMYECIMGMRSRCGEGAILADEMGLGKTLQVIALLWTLLKQNPVYDEKPIVKKALIVCPVTLIRNWRKEIQKWLGNERIGVFVVEDNKARLTDFTKGRSYHVMIIGYEKLRIVQEELQGCGIDIVIADEGHRLKSAKNKSAQAIKSLSTERRIILSGTPLQNDLSEFYFMADFVNPGILGKNSAFKREFEGPIVKSRQPGASAKDKEKGEARSEELANLTGQFILRRTADVMAGFLPQKTEYTLFCRPTHPQVEAYRSILASPAFSTIFGNPEARLLLINVLKKVCNSPNLLKVREESEESSNSTIASLVADIPSRTLNFSGSGKLRVLDNLLHNLRTLTQEKVVLVSHYTTTLDVIGQLLTTLGYSFLRLDGTVPTGKRQGLVDKFNRTDAATCFAFLLSAKAGGVGLNLIGASRLILYDVDWNPSTDLQAMARIHRDGQKRPCKIYRLLTQGALDEKIYQRQVTKQGLADSIVDNKASISNFTTAELRDLFALDEASTCQTHDLLGCACGGKPISLADSPADMDALEAVNAEREDGSDDLPDLPQLVKASQVNIDEQEKKICQKSHGRAGEKAQMSALMHYQHLDTSVLKENMEAMEDLIDDEVLLNVLKDDDDVNSVPFMFVKVSG